MARLVTHLANEGKMISKNSFGNISSILNDGIPRSKLMTTLYLSIAFGDY